MQEEHAAGAIQKGPRISETPFHCRLVPPLVDDPQTECPPLTCEERATRERLGNGPLRSPALPFQSSPENMDRRQGAARKGRGLEAVSSRLDQAAD